MGYLSFVASSNYDSEIATWLSPFTDTTDLPMAQCYLNPAQGWSAGMWSSYFTSVAKLADKMIVTIPLLVGTGWNVGGTGGTTSPNAPTDTTGAITNGVTASGAGTFTFSFNGHAQTAAALTSSSSASTIAAAIDSAIAAAIAASAGHGTNSGTSCAGTLGTNVTIKLSGNYQEYSSQLTVSGGASSVLTSTATAMTLAAVAAGTWDAMFTKVFQAIAAVRPDALLRMGWEMYGSWYAWGGSGNAAGHKAATQHLTTLARSISSTFQFIWDGGAITGTGYDPTNPTTGSYPGDSYVDYIAADIYDSSNVSSGPFGATGWTSNTHGGYPYISSGYTFAQAHGKPFCIPEFGLWPSGLSGGAYGGGDDLAWAQALCNWVTTTPGVAFAMAFENPFSAGWSTYPTTSAWLGPEIVASIDVFESSSTAYPTLSCKVAFASDPFDSPLVWTELGPASGAGPAGLGWLRGFTSKRGRERLLRSQAQFQAGTLAATLDNRDRRFDPTNAASPYWPNVQPEKVIQIGATYAGTYYPVWTGYVDDWPQSWPGFQEGSVALVATDLFKSLSIKRIDANAYANTVLEDGATGYWRLQDPVGALSVLDSSGNGLTGLVSGNVTLGVTGALLWAASTAATLAPASGLIPSGVIQIPDFGVGLTPPGITFEFWIQTTAVSTIVMGAGLPLVEISAGGAIDSVFGTNTVGMSGTAVVNDGDWHYVVLAYGIGSGGAQQYVDGVLDTSSATSPVVILPSIGQLAADGGAWTVEDFAIYPSQLTSVQVTTHFGQAEWAAGYTGEQFGYVLDNVGVPSTLRNVDTGRTMCQADTQDETQTKSLAFLQKLEQTEQGQCYVSAGGFITFEDRYHRFQSPDANSVATFGDGGSAHPSEIPYTMGGVILNFDRAELFNDVQVTRRNGILQEAVNQASVGQFTNRTMPGLSDLMMAADLDALYCAQWIVADTAYPQLRVGNLILDPTEDPRLWPLVLGLEIGNIVTVNKHNIPGGGAAISTEVRVEGIEHQVDAPRSWKTTIHLSLVDTQPWFILDDPVMGILDAGNRLGW